MLRPQQLSAIQITLALGLAVVRASADNALHVSVDAGEEHELSGAPSQAGSGGPEGPGAGGDDEEQGTEWRLITLIILIFKTIMLIILPA